MLVEPVTATEQQLLSIWKDVLSVENIGIVDNFFVIGGHSLLAVQIMLRIRKQFDIEIPVRVLFDNTTVKTLAQHLDNVLWLNETVVESESMDFDDIEDFEEGEL